MSDINDSSMVSAAGIVDRLAPRLSGFGATILDGSAPDQIVLAFADGSEYTITVEKTRNSEAELAEAEAAFNRGAQAAKAIIDRVHEAAQAGQTLTAYDQVYGGVSASGLSPYAKAGGSPATEPAYPVGGPDS